MALSKRERTLRQKIKEAGMVRLFMNADGDGVVDLKGHHVPLPTARILWKQGRASATPAIQKLLTEGR